MKVLFEMKTTDTVNNKDLKAAIPLDGDIYLSGPLSFKDISVGNLLTKDFITNIDFNHWMANSFRLWAQQPQVVTGHWTLRNAALDSIYSESGVNGIDAAAYASKIELANRSLYQNYMETCNRVHGLIDASRENVMFLSHFELAFKLPHVARVASIYLFEVGRQNYLLTNAGCRTWLHYWNHQTQRYERLSDAYTGVVTSWIHLLDLRSEMIFVGNSEQPSATTGCTISGANIWKYQSDTRTIVSITSFGDAGDFRSLQAKPNSRTHFYAVRVADGRVIEFNADGTPVTEWVVDQVQGRSSAWSFVPSSANLGLAISNGESMSLLTTNGTKAMLPTNVENPERETERTVAKLRKAFADYNAAKATILSDKRSNPRIEKIRERIRKIDESMVPLANELIEALENGLHSTATVASTNQPIGADDVGANFGLDIGGRVRDLIINELDVVLKFATGELDESDEDSDEDGLFSTLHMSSVDSQRSANGEPTPTSANNEPELGDKFGDLLSGLTPTADALFDKLIEKIRLRKTESNYRAENDADNYRPDDTLLGDKFGDLMDKLTPVADEVFDKLMDFIRKEKPSESSAQRDYDLESVRNATEPSAEDQLVGELFSYLQGKIQLELKRYRNDPNVGDKFGEVMEDLTPTVDFVFNELIDKIRAKKRRRPMLVDEAARAANPPNREQLTSNGETIVGDKFGELMDKLTPTSDALFDKLIDKIRSEKTENDRQLNAYDYENVGNTKTVATRPEDVLGDKFGDLMDKLTPVVDVVFDKVMDYIRKEKPSESDAHGDYEVERVLNAMDSSAEDGFVRETSRYLQGEIQSELMAYQNRRTNDSIVGDKFGDAMDDLTPVVDKLFDKLIDKIRARKRPISSDSFSQSIHTTMNASMDDIARRIQAQHSEYHDPFKPNDLLVQGAHRPSKGVFDFEQAILDAVKVVRSNETMLGSAHNANADETVTSFGGTLKKYAQIAKNIYEQGKAVYHELKDDYFDPNDDYAAPESHQRPQQNGPSYQYNNENYQPENTDPPEPSYRPPQFHHGSNGGSQFSHSFQSDSSRPNSHHSHQQGFNDMFKPFRPHKENVNTHTESDGTEDSNDTNNSETIVPTKPHSLFDGHQPHIHDLDIPPEHIRHNGLNNITEAIQARMRASPLDQLFGLARNKPAERRTDEGGESFLGLSHTASDSILDADSTVGDAFQKYAEFVKSVHSKGQSVVGEMKNGTRSRHEPNMSSKHEAATSPKLPDSELSHVSDFHDDTEELLNQLLAVDGKYSEPNVGDKRENEFRTDVHNLFVQMNRVIAKYTKSGEQTHHHEPRRQLRKRDGARPERIEAMSLSMPSPQLPTKSANEVVAVTVGAERKPLIITSSQRENVIKGDHDTIQVSSRQTMRPMAF